MGDKRFTNPITVPSLKTAVGAVVAGGAGVLIFLHLKERK